MASEVSAKKLGSLTPRERFLHAVDRTEDRDDLASLDLGYGIASYTRGAHDRLCDYLGIDCGNVEVSSRMLNIVYPSREIADCLSGDLRVIAPAGPLNGMGDVELDDRSYRDEWDLVRRISAGGLYYDFIGAPLAACRTLEECLARLRRPTGASERAQGMFDRAAAHRAEGYAVGAWCFAGIFEMLFWLRGYKLAYLDFAQRPNLVEGLMDALLAIQIEFWTAILQETKGLLDVVLLTEDLGTQTGLMISPAQFRAIVKPRFRELIRAIRNAAPDVRILLHSDGAVAPLVGDLIEIGVDILNPIQPGASGMDPAWLKAEFGEDLSFHGGLDIQGLLVQGTPTDVRREVERLFDVFGTSGGYVMAPAHCIQPDVPPENIQALVDSVLGLRAR